ncbi:UDP-glucose/GDP-mannose dehydrogenase family protein [Nitrososphaera sp.]|uniref:UDP-glucose dehydrogenase family protein n=1 Tax=Nitrososphaera sp. TaxID=1971748 RepID=UPI0017EA6BB5|nr:UDP-glucose/GDP-mannose dehydrogenase family protein [Nitrososphaera sp.]NWG36459.1 UDP-glucose/GDP-mannose dehydrogenase family protein [Nitrososphaera sp.]
MEHVFIGKMSGLTHKVSIIGMGFVGLTTAAVFAKKGALVYGVDSDENKIDIIRKGRAPFFEPKLDALVKRAVAQKRLVPTSSIAEAIDNSDLTFICVGTPMNSDGSVNLDYVARVSLQIGQVIKDSRKYHVFCVKSTVPPGTTGNVVTKNIEAGSNKQRSTDFGIAMTPEFLREGSAVEDSLNPHIIVIGTGDKKVDSRVHSFFRNLYGPRTKILKTNIVTAELIKYSNNSFLATKISFINTIANVCNKIPGADVDIIAGAIGTDPRIGSQFLSAGPGYGGSCFPKDVSGFIQFCKTLGLDPTLLEATDRVNKLQAQAVIDLVKHGLGPISGKSITVLGTSFKKNTDDIRESVSIRVIDKLLELGAIVRIHDPMAMDNTRTVFGNKIEYPASLANALKNTDCVVLMTDWDDYRVITEKMIRKFTSKCAVIDTKRFLQVKETADIKYLAIGKTKATLSSH